jgi:hypothetical protein
MMTGERILRKWGKSEGSTLEHLTIVNVPSSCWLSGRVITQGTPYETMRFWSRIGDVGVGALA